MDLREEQVVLETDRYRIVGPLTLPREGYRSRLSDYVNQRDREFFAVSDGNDHLARQRGVDPAGVVHHGRRRHVTLVALAGEEQFAG